MVYEDLTKDQLIDEINKLNERIARIVNEEKNIEEARSECCDIANDVIMLLDATDIGFYGLDEDGKCTLFNKAAASMTQYSRNDIIGRSIHGFIHHSKADGSPYPQEECPIISSFKAGKGIRADKDVFWRKDGTSFPVEYSSYPIMEAGAIKGAVVTFYDITSRKQAEAELNEAKAQAELYLDLMAHDINNMNTVAMGYLELALEKPAVGEEDRPLLEKPLEMLKGSSALIENVRKLKQARSEMRLEPVDIASILKEIVPGYMDAFGRDVRIELTCATECRVNANPLLKDVFTNIVGNAIKHSTGSLTINVCLSSLFEKDKMYCKVSIEDNGPGIPDDLKKKLFSRKHTASVKGLGLYLVKTLVERFNGRVSVEDRVAGDRTKGSRFIVLIPSV